MSRVALALLLLVPAAAALPTPGLNGEATEAALGRVFPEALATNDYVGFEEAVAGLTTLATRHADRVELREIGESVGWANPVTGELEPSPILVVEVTNEKSQLSYEQKRKVVFSLSIHGNEKGGREGGLRAIEDLAAGLGILEEEPELEALLDLEVLIFIFPNPDGWRHEELAYRTREACYVSLTCAYGSGGDTKQPGAETQNFVRVNGNGIDLNRQFPAAGFREDGPIYETLSQPEARAIAAYLANLTRPVAAVDVHGMVQHDHFYLILNGGGSGDPAQLFASERLAELAKERVNANPYYRAWRATPHVPGYWGGEETMAEWMSGNDAIGYSASGSLGGFFAGEGLEVPAFTIELAYNHIVVDNYYPGAGAALNDMHVRAVRDTVITFMRFGAERTEFSLDAGGHRIAWFATDRVATNRDDDRSSYTGWFTQTDADDAWDLEHKPFEATPNDWFVALFNVAAEADRPAVLDEARSVDELKAAADLSRHDTVVIVGSAAEKLAGRADAVLALRTFAEKGGRVVLLDSALALLPALGLAKEGDVDQVFAYSGYTDLADATHDVAKDLRGRPRQTYGARDLGYVDGQAPVWYVKPQAWDAAGGETIGTVSVETAGFDPQTGNPKLDGARGVNLGVAPVGQGSVAILGAILPDPTEENNHPYGLESYSVTSAGSRILLWLLGYEPRYEAPPLVLDDLARIDDLLPGEAAGADAGEAGGRFLPAPLALLVVPAALLLRRRS